MDLWVAGGMVGVAVVVVVSTSTDNTGISNQYAVHGTGPLGDTIGVPKHQEERRLENLGVKCWGIS